MIQVRDLHKRFDTTRAVDGVSFDMKQGEILGFLGPNGAGKTTTMRDHHCYLPPTSGSVEVDGLDVVEPLARGAQAHRLPAGKRAALRRHERPSTTCCSWPRCATSPRPTGADGAARDRRLRLGRCHRQERRAAVERLPPAHRTGASDRPRSADSRPRRADARPGPEPIVEIRQLIRDLGKAEDGRVLDHILSEVEAMCDRVIVINKGKKVFDGSKSDMRAGASGKERVFVELRANGDAAAHLRGLRNVDACTSCPRDGGLTRLHIDAPRGQDLRESIFDAAVQQGWKVLEMRARPRASKDVFRELTHQRR
jgi:ABC-2 type transport system ATP-binding protein